MSDRRLMILPAAALILAGASLAYWMQFPPRPAVAAPPAAVTPVSGATSPNTSTPVTIGGLGVNLRRTVTVQVVQKTKNAVVNISTTKLVNQRVMVGGAQFWQQFDTGQIVQVPANSLGSGFVIHPDGYVVTNNHVIDHARQITVELADGRRLPADLISADADADLAVLRIHSPTPLPSMELGESGDLMIGEPVIAVGNPLGFSHSVSTGIVSALHRDIDPHRSEAESDAPLKGEEAALRDLIQTDAAINPGNSGGPLLNAYGQVIGINTAIKANAQNIGFAIPIDRLRDLIPELMNPTQAIKVDVPIKLAEHRTMTEPSTVNVTVTEAGNGPVLQSINGVHPADIVDAYAMLLKAQPGQPFDIVWAGGKTQRVIATAAPVPDAIVQAKRLMGITVVQNTPMLADKDHLFREDGLLLTAVDPDSVADRGHLQTGDVIYQVGRFPTPTLETFGLLVPRFPKPGAGAATFFIQRGQQRYRVTVQF
jgi:serine protease Do